MQIIIYATTTCPYCKMLKNYLDNKQVVYHEKLVDQDDQAREEMAKVSGGFLGVPFTVIEKEDGTKETIVGFDQGRLNRLLNFSQ